MAPLLEVRGLSFQSILRGVSFCVEKGEYLAVVGQNGAGKSTLLRCLDRILSNWTGEVLLSGVSIRAIPRKGLARRIAYLRQGAGLVPDITVRHFVLTGRYPHRGFFAPTSRRDEMIAENALRLTETLPLADRKLAALSGGEQQRVRLAAAVAQEAEVLLLDEPTVYLDYRRRDETNALLDKIRRETGAALLEVTHDLNRTLASADAILALKGGEALYCGKPAGMMTGEMLRNVFETELDVVTIPGRAKPLVMPGNVS